MRTSWLTGVFYIVWFYRTLANNLISLSACSKLELSDKASNTCSFTALQIVYWQTECPARFAGPYVRLTMAVVLRMASKTRIDRRHLLSYLLTFLFTPWCRVLIEKLAGSQLVKKFPAFYGTRKFITAFTSACQLCLSWVRSIQSITPHPTVWRSILILSSHLRLGLPSGLFSSGFPTKTLYTHLLSSIRATCPSNFVLLGLITRKILGEQYRSLRSSLCSFLLSPVTSSLLGPNILRSNLFSYTLSQSSSPCVSD